MFNIPFSTVGIVFDIVVSVNINSIYKCFQWRLKKLVFFLFVFFLLTFLVKNETAGEEIEFNNNIEDTNAENNQDAPLELNLQMKIEEVKKFPDIKPDKCVNTARLQGIFCATNNNNDVKSLGVITKICIKPLSVDKFVSGSIISTGVWEKPIVMKVMKSMELYPNAVFLDIGANIGRESL